MDVREREELNLGIELARNNQPQAAYFIFARLREKYPQNNQIVVLTALTSPEPVETQQVFEAAMHLEPTDPILGQAIEWLEKRPAAPLANRLVTPSSANAKTKSTPEIDSDPTVKKATPEVDPDPTVRKPFVNQLEYLRTVQTQTVARPAQTRTATVPPPNLTGEISPAFAITPEAMVEPEAETIRPGRKASKAGKFFPKGRKESQSRTPIATFSLLWWVRLACSLLLFGSALGIIFILGTGNNLNETEKAYAEGVRSLTQKTSTVNTQLQTAIAEFNAGKLDKAGLETQLKEVIGLNDQLKQLKSPSTRFDKLDGFLGVAYGYFNDGATNLVNGLESGNWSQFSDSYHLFDLGNDSLRQARDELKALGG